MIQAKQPTFFDPVNCFVLTNELLSIENCYVIKG